MTTSRPTVPTRARWRPAAWAATTLTVSGVVAALVTATIPDPAGLRSDAFTAVGATVARAASDAAGVAVVGIALAALLLSTTALPPAAERPAQRLAARADRLLVVVAAAWFVLVLVAMAFRAAYAFGRDVAEVGVDQALLWVTDIAAGRGTALTAVCALVVLAAAVVRLAAPGWAAIQVPLIAGFMGVLTPTITGHAASDAGHSQAVVSAAVHAAAASAWVGGLAAVILLFSAHRDVAEAVLPVFSRVAAVCIVALAITGGWSAYVRMEGLGLLFTTSYGAIVLAKSALFVALAALGWLTRRRLHRGRRPVLRWATIEVTVMAVALGLAATLAQTAPTA